MQSRFANFGFHALGDFNRDFVAVIGANARHLANDAARGDHLIPALDRCNLGLMLLELLLLRTPDQHVEDTEDQQHRQQNAGEGVGTGRG